MNNQVSKLKMFLFMILLFSFPVYADIGFKPIVIGAMLIFFLLLVILAFMISSIHFYFTRKIFHLEFGYSKLVKYTILSAIPGILILVFLIPKKDYTEWLFLAVVSISMTVCPILLFFIQKSKQRIL